jgi:acetyl esterase/lipase
MSEIATDLRRAIRFIRFNADKYGVDAERFGLWGRSAGGYLSLLLGTTADIKYPDATEEFEKGTGRFASGGCVLPAYRFKMIDRLWRHGFPR